MPDQDCSSLRQFVNSLLCRKFTPIENHLGEVVVYLPNWLPGSCQVKEFIITADRGRAVYQAFRHEASEEVLTELLI